MPDLSPRTTLDGGFEIALARVRLVQLMNAQDSASQAQWLSYERAILGYLGRIASMIDAGIRRRQLQLDLFRLLEGSPVVSAPSSDCATGDSNLVRTSTVDHGASRV